MRLRFAGDLEESLPLRRFTRRGHPPDPSIVLDQRGIREQVGDAPIAEFVLAQTGRPGHRLVQLQVPGFAVEYPEMSWMLLERPSHQCLVPGLLRTRPGLCG